LFSLGCAIFLSFASYFANNIPIFTRENPFYIQELCDFLHLGHKKDSIDTDAAFINVSWDKILVPKYDEEDAYTKHPIGKEVVTDREKLFKFLKGLKERGGYKYILMDIWFDRDDTSSHDDQLFDLMSDMDNFVFFDKDSLSFSGTIANRYPELNKKAATAKYYNTIRKPSFSRYKYIDGKIPSMPLKVLQDIDSTHKLKKYGPFYTDACRLCNNSVFLLFDRDEDEREWMDLRTYNLGNDFADKIDSPEDTTIIDEKFNRLKDKYIIIGDFQNDLHNTYHGRLPGSLILFRALQTLQNGKHYVNPLLAIIWFIVYFCISYQICTRETKFLFFIKWKFRSKTFEFLSHIAWYDSFLFSVQVVEYKSFGTVHSLVVLLILVDLLRLCFEANDYIKWNKNIIKS